MKKHLLYHLFIYIFAITLFSPALFALDPAPGYVGSMQCSVCHPQIFEQWKTTLHSDIYKPVEPEKMIADWSGEVVLSDPGKNIPPTTFVLDNNGGNGPYTATFLGQTYTVDRIHGGRALDRNEDPNNPNQPGSSKYIGKQRYHTKIGDNYMILPMQWNPVPNLDGNKAGWVPYHIEDWVTPEGAFEPKLVSQSEERRCAGCHQTGIQINFNEAIQRYELGRIEENIACEACHGPGEEHVMTANADLIIHPSKLQTVQQRMDVCGQCHTRVSSIEEMGGRKFGFPYNGRAIQPGDVLEDFATSSGGFWGSGISKQHRQQRYDYLGHDGLEASGHAAAGLTCFSCHSAHGSEFEHDLVATARDNTLCLNCHGNMFPDITAIESHSKHSMSAAGAPNCVSCHMSTATKSGVEYDGHQHNFKVLTPAQTLTHAQPNACAICHRSYNGVTDTNITAWDEESDIIINTWLDEQFKVMFGSSSVKDWDTYN